MELLASRSASEYATLRAASSDFAPMSYSQLFPQDPDENVIAEDGSNVVMDLHEDAILLGLKDD